MFIIYITHEGHHIQKAKQNCKLHSNLWKEISVRPNDGIKLLSPFSSLNLSCWCFFLCILDSPVNSHLPLLPLMMILLCSVDTNRASLSGSYLVGWNRDSSICLNPSVLTGGGWVHTDSLIYLQPLQSPGWELGEHWGRQHANSLNYAPWGGLSSGQILPCFVTEQF